MGTSLEDEKTSSVVDDHVDELPTTRTQQWMKKTTTFLAHWGIETNGWVWSELVEVHADYNFAWKH